MRNVIVCDKCGKVVKETEFPASWEVVTLRSGETRDYCDVCNQIILAEVKIADKAGVATK